MLPEDRYTLASKLLSGLACAENPDMVPRLLLLRRENIRMQDQLLKIFVKTQFRLESSFRNLIKDESGQDIIEYAIVVGLIAFGATATMKSFATSISTAFSQVAGKLTTYTS
jgi:pilus assembly protein Flp/PilA